MTVDIIINPFAYHYYWSPRGPIYPSPEVECGSGSMLDCSKSIKNNIVLNKRK